MGYMRNTSSTRDTCISIFFSLPFPSSRSNLERIEDTLAVLRDLTIGIEAFYRNPTGKSTTSLFILKRLEASLSVRSSSKEVCRLGL